MLKNKKKLIYIIVAVLLAIAITIGIIFIIRSLSPQDSDDSIPTTASANELKSQAVTAMQTNNNVRAKTLLQEAQQQYRTLGDTNNVVDTSALLYLIDHATTSPVK